MRATFNEADYKMQWAIVRLANVKTNKRMASSTTAASGSSSSGREGTAKAMVFDQISQTIQSTSNLLHLMQQSSPSQVQLTKLPKNLLAKTSTIKNTGQVLEQMPEVISSLDTHVENGLQSVPHLRTVSQLLANMESCQLSSLSQAHLPEKEPEKGKQAPAKH